MSVQLGQFGVSERLILWRCLLRHMCPVMMHIPVRYLVRLLRLFLSILSIFVWWLPSKRSVCACLLEFTFFRLLTLSFIMFLMWFSGRIDVFHDSKNGKIISLQRHFYRMSQIVHFSGKIILDFVQYNDWSFLPLQGSGVKLILYLVFIYLCAVYVRFELMLVVVAF